jgi:hypothetical protein
MFLADHSLYRDGEQHGPSLNANTVHVAMLIILSIAYIRPFATFKFSLFQARLSGQKISNLAYQHLKIHLLGQHRAY